jgi:rhodanese-related sulfurtransferase
MKTIFGAFFALFVFLAGPVLADAVSPVTIDGATTVSTDEAKSLFDKGVLFVDVRKDSDWDAGRIPGAVHLELNSVFSEEELGKVIGKDDEVVIYCNGESCLRSSEACVKAVSWGFANVHYYRDGFPDWDAAGNPVE